MHRIPIFVAALIVLACSVDSTAPSQRSLRVGSPAAAIESAAPEFPNVVRFGSEYAFGIQDPETNLLAWAGLPYNPKDYCSGSQPFTTAEFQYVGFYQDAIKILMATDHVNLHVYERSSFQGFCISDPIAQGIGRMMYIDNDGFFTGHAANAWGFRMGGSVSLVAGGTANLEAHNRFQVLPDGSFRRIFRKVRLSSQ